MSHQELAIEFIKKFCAGDIEGLALLLSENLQFKGPLFQFNSREAYLLSLKQDPAQPADYRVISITESPDHISIFYDYEKNEGSITIAQLFRFKDQKICEILIVFDGREFG